MFDVGAIGRTKAAMLLVLALMLVPALAQVVQPSVAVVVPIDIVALVTALFAGITTVASIIFLPIMAWRQKRAELAAAASAIEAAKAQAAMALELAKSQTALEQTKLEIMRAQVELSHVKETVSLVERNTNSMTSTIKELAGKAGIAEGVALQRVKGEETAKTLAEGQRQGMEIAAAVAAAAAGAPTPAAPAHAGEKPPLPVADDKTATAAERSADAQERTAEAAERKPGG